MDTIFSSQEFSRYHRHLILPGFGPAAQEKLKKASILVVGAGGLGCPALLYLAAAGIGTIGIADFDLVEDSNLQRQVLFTTQDIGRNKAIVAKERLQELNPYIEIIACTQKISMHNALELLMPYDIVIDGTDNFPTRYLLNDACIFLEKTYIYGAIAKFEGQVSVFNCPDEQGERGPNYRDLYPVPPPQGLVPSCADGGVLGVLPGVIGTLQASEAIKVVARIGQTLRGRLWMFDALSMESRSIRMKKRADNPVTGIAPTILQLIDYELYCGIDTSITQQNELSAEALEAWKLSGKPFQLIDVREPFEYKKHNLGGLLIPLDSLILRIDEILTSIPVVIHCQSGRRSAEAIKKLTQKGFNNLYNLTGGIESCPRDFRVKF